MHLANINRMVSLIAALVALQSPPTFFDDPLKSQPYKAMRSGSHNKDDNSNDDSWRLPAGETITLLDAEGPGMVTHFWITIANNEYSWPSLLRLRVFYDGATSPSVDVPLGDFFATGWGRERDVNSLMVRNTSEGRAKNAYWKMPFKKHCKMTLTNEGTERSWLNYFQVDWRKYKSLPKDILYFHASYRQEFPHKKGPRYTILDTTGNGVYVGTVLNVIPNLPGWFGEGDEYFFVDGETEASLKGTGTEDFFTDAWGLHEHSGLYYGTTAAGGFQLGDRVSAYRWQIPDPVPFQKSLKLEIEDQGWVFQPDGKLVGSFVPRDDELSSVAFWYQRPFRTDLPAFPGGKARLPYGNATIVQPEKGIDSVSATGGKVEVQNEVFWGQNILFFKGEGAGSSVSIPLSVSEKGTWEVQALLLRSYDYGIYDVELDGKKVIENIDLYDKETRMPQGVVFGRIELTQGSHQLKFICKGKNSASTGYYFGCDQVVLSKIAR